MTQIENLEEELFCVNYEIKIFAGYVNYGRLERWLPGFADKATEESHLSRYKFASKYTAGKIVLDMASGSGFGSYILATEGNAKNVTGIDIETDTIRYASHRNKNDNITYLNGDATSYFNENFYDVIVSFETVEHLTDYEQYLKSINKSLKPGGFLIISTPISKYKINNNPLNKFHIREWGLTSFQKDVSAFLKIKETFFQLYPYRNDRLANRFIRKILNTPSAERFSTIYNALDLPRHIKISQIGDEITGYQILVCEKK